MNNLSRNTSTGVNGGRMAYVPPTLKNGYEYSNAIMEPADSSDDSVPDLMDADKDPTTCRDSFCAAVFILQLATFVTVSLVYLHDFQLNVPKGAYEWGLSLWETVAFFGVTAGMSGIIASVFACAWLLLAARFRFVMVSCIATILSYLALIIWLVMENGVTSVVYLPIVVVCFVSLFLIGTRDDIEFTETLIKVAFRSLTRYWGVFVVAFVAIAISILAGIYYFVAMLAMRVIIWVEAKNDPFVMLFMWLSSIISGVWLQQTIMSISFVTTSGSVGVWYYTILQSWDALSSLRRATSTSLGSVAWAALVVAPATWIQSLTCYSHHDEEMQGPKNNSNSFADEDDDQRKSWRCQHPGAILTRYCNRLALTHVALHGIPFFKASTSADDLLMTRGSYNMLEANITCNTVAVVSLLGGLVATVTAGQYQYHKYQDNDSCTYASMLLAISFIVGFFSSKIIFKQLSAAVCATLTIYTQDSATMATNRPDAHNLITSARIKRFETDEDGNKDLILY